MNQDNVKITNSIKRIKEKDGTHLNNYLVGKQIGDGPYAKIKLLTDLNDNNKQYAVKKFTLYLLKKKTRMIRDNNGNNKYISVVDDVEIETSIMIPLNHPNVIKLHEVMRTQDNGKLYLIMEYCKFGPISDWDSKKLCFHTRTEVLQTKFFTKILIGILLGLQYLHENNIMHRDLKPGNILLNQDYTPKIIDFGRAVKLEKKDQLLRGSQGTYHFMAPQMLSEKQKAGYDARKSDIWSLGVTIYCAVTSSLPFYVEPIMKLFQSIQSSKFTYPEKAVIPKHIKQIINGCIVHDPLQRLSINEMLEICTQYLRTA